MALTAPHRRGAIATMVALILAGSASLLVISLSARAATRRVEIGERVARAQAREWCLGAASLAPASEAAVGPWRIARAADGTRTAMGPRGVYRIMSDGKERWSRR